MRNLVLQLLVLLFLLELTSSANAFIPTRHVLRPLFSIATKWMRRSSHKTSQSEGSVIQYESGYLVETIMEGNKMGMSPYSIRVSPEGELFAVDSDNSNIVRITPPLSHYSRARLVAGSFQGHSGHIDGKPSEARFNHPKGFAMDDRGYVYVADIANMAIRKIGESGVTTIAGGKSNLAGYADGPSEDAKFSSDFDVVYDRSSCSLIVVDRGNAALRQILFHGDECAGRNHSFLSSDILMIFGAILVGYITCLLQDGLGPSHLFNTQQESENGFQDTTASKTAAMSRNYKHKSAEWWLIVSRVFHESHRSISETISRISLNPFSWVRASKVNERGLHPLMDNLVMPEDNLVKTSVHRNRRSWNPPDTHAQQVSFVANDYTQPKPPRTKTVGSSKDYSTSNKIRSSKRQDMSDFYASGEAAAAQHGLHSSKSQKDRNRYRTSSHDRAREAAGFGIPGSSSKHVEARSYEYLDPKMDSYGMRKRFSVEDGHFKF